MKKIILREHKRFNQIAVWTDKVLSEDFSFFFFFIAPILLCIGTSVYLLASQSFWKIIPLFAITLGYLIFIIISPRNLEKFLDNPPWRVDS